MKRRKVLDALRVPLHWCRRLTAAVIRPRSISGLVLTSFAVVAAPLIVAIGASVLYVDRLNTQSEHLVMQGVAVTRDSKRLSSLLVDMERTARQYRIVGAQTLVSRFGDQAAAFEHELQTLAHLHLDTLPDWDLTPLEQRVRGLAAQLGQSKQATAHVIQALGAVHDTTHKIANAGAAFVDKELDRLQATARRARMLLLVCVFAVVPAVIALGVFLTFVISRPLRQILDAVAHLGTGDFTRPVSIVAPAAELDRLGERLDWMRRRLATLDEEKQQFLRHMSHELKTPLASIREGTELLTDGSVGPLSEAQQEVATILRTSSEDLTGLIDNLLNFAARQQQRAGLEITEFDLAALIERVLVRQKLSIEARGLRVARPESPLRIAADADRLQLIVDNLVANAVKYSPTAGMIRIEAEIATQALALTVADQGPGVAEHERERVFDAFVLGTSEPAADRGVKGTGIGLSVVRDCARAHGGEVTIIDDDEFCSVFHVHIPLPYVPD